MPCVRALPTSVPTSSAKLTILSAFFAYLFKACLILNTSSFPRLTSMLVFPYMSSFLLPFSILPNSASPPRQPISLPGSPLYLLSFSLPLLSIPLPTHVPAYMSYHFPLLPTHLPTALLAFLLIIIRFLPYHLACLPNYPASPGRIKKA